MREDFKVSAFNQAQLQIQRLDENFKRAATNNVKNQLSKYKSYLRVIELELLYDAKKLDKGQKTRYIKDLQDIEREISNSAKNLNLIEFKENLERKEIILREIQEESGKGSMWKDEFEDEFD